MIKDDVKRIREGKSPKIRGGMLEDLTDDFRGGRRQQNELLELLDDQDEYYH